MELTEKIFPATAMPDRDWWAALWPDPEGVLRSLGLEPGMVVVDLCCGDGYFTAPLARIVGGQVYGVDIDPAMLEQARVELEHAGATVLDLICADARDLPKLLPRNVDYVLIANTFHGVPEKTTMANSVTFAHADDLSDVMSAFGMVSYVLVDAEKGVDAVTLAKRIREQVDKVNAMPLKNFIASDHAMAMQMGVEIINIMSLIGMGLAIVITGFTVYSQTNRRRHELAVAKALGVRNRAVYGSVLLQAVCIALLGLTIATALAYAAAPLIEALVPLVALTIEPEVPLKLGLLALVIAAIASLIPARQVLRVDPAMAFHG